MSGYLHEEDEAGVRFEEDCGTAKCGPPLLDNCGAPGVHGGRRLRTVLNETCV